MNFRQLRSARSSLAVALLSGTVFGCSPRTGPGEAPAAPPPPPDPPRLAVLLVVDQLPTYLIDQYRDLFAGGLLRLLDRGLVIPNTTHDHAMTETAPGHATLATGTHPSRHGIVGNHWYEQDPAGEWRSVVNVADLRTRVAGAPTVGGVSPTALRRDGLADWLVAADPLSRIVSLSGKDRAAVLLGGRGGRGAGATVVWFEAQIGRFATSTHYASFNPAWLRSFNGGELRTHEQDTVWASGVPDVWRIRSRPDTASYEGDGVLTAFPHRYADARASDPGLDFWTWWAGTPFLDRATLALARAAVEAERLGQDPVPDLLAISLSQTDRVGHAFGPGSREQLDNLLRLDDELGAFFSWLDDEVGVDRWVVAFTSDHGVLEIPEARLEAGLPGLRLTPDSVETLQRVVDREAARVEGEIESISSPLARAIVDEVPWVARAWSADELAGMQVTPDSFAVLERNSLHAGRPQGLLSRAGVLLHYTPHTLGWSYERGTGHGSPYLYDRQVPLIFLGNGIPARIDSTRASAVDVAPTLARILGISFPGDLDGQARRVR